VFSTRDIETWLVQMDNRTETQYMAVPKDPNSWHFGSYTNVLGCPQSLQENVGVVHYNKK